MTTRAPSDARTLGGRYEFLEVIGKGAAAEVCTVRDLRDGTVKVAKRLHASPTENVVRRFEDEFRILRGLHHPGLPQVYDYGWTPDDSRYMIMEFVEGRALDQYLRDHPDDLWVLLYQLCEVLTFIHSHSLLHQDIKPDNILVKRTAAFGDEMPLAVLIDFGLTHRRDAGEDVQMVGTPQYMAPEIIRGESPLTRAVDYYSLGVTLYQLLTGTLPFTGTGREIFDGHLNRAVTFERELIQYADLYPHVRGLMTKDKMARLEAFESFKRAVIGRMTGGIDELEQAYALSRINSLGMIGKDDVWTELMEWVGAGATDGTLVLSGEPGSGRTYILDHLDAELSIQGHRPLILGSDQPNNLKDHGTSSDRLIAIWDDLCSRARRGTSFIFVDDADKLEPRDSELVDYLQRRARLEDAADRPAIRFVLSSEPGQLTSHQIQRDEIAIPPLTEEDHRVLMSRFRGMSATRDSEQLQQFLTRRGHRMQNVHEGLTSAIVDRSAAYTGGKWRFELSNVTESAGQDSYYKRIIDSLTPEERWLLFAIACSKTPVGEQVLLELLGTTSKNTAQHMARIESMGLIIRRVTPEGLEFRCSSEVARSHIYAEIPHDERQRYHRAFLRIIQRQGDHPHDEERRARQSRQMSFHLQGLPDYRESLRHLLHALRFHYESADTISVQRVAADGLELCSSWESQTKSTSPASFRRYLIRTWLRSEWRQANYHEIRRIIEKHYDDDSLPLSFATKYSRALAEAGQPVRAAEILETGIARTWEDSLTSLQLRVELAMAVRASSQYKRALQLLDAVEPLSWRLDEFSRCRLYVNYCVVYTTLGVDDEALASAKKAEAVARANQFNYELSVIYHARANIQFGSQQLTEAMRTIAAGIRFCSRHRVHKRLGDLYFEASSVYFSMGEYDRCINYLGKALRVAERIGESRSVGVYLTRFAMIHQGLGQYGNALRFIDRAEQVWKMFGSTEEAFLLKLVSFDIALDLGREDTVSIKETLKKMVRITELTPSVEGYYQLLMGRYFEGVGSLEDAHRSYSVALSGYEKASIEDDALVAAIGLARTSLRMGDTSGYAKYMAYAREKVALVESSNTTAQFTMMLLEESLFSGGTTDVALMRKCEDDRSRVTEVIVQLRYDSLLCRAWRTSGNSDLASRAFRRFSSIVKKLVANLPNRDYANQFLKQEYIAQLLKGHHPTAGQ